MKTIEIKIGSQAGVKLFGYDKNAMFPFSKLPQCWCTMMAMRYM